MTGWRVASASAGGAVGAALGGLITFLISLVPLFILLSFMGAVPEARHLGGRSVVVSVLLLAALSAMLLGWLGSKAFARCGRGHAA